MAEIKRFGPFKIRGYVKHDGGPEGRLVLTHQSIIVEAVGNDGEVHSGELLLGLDVTGDRLENFFQSAELALKTRMMNRGLWDGDAV